MLYRDGFGYVYDVPPECEAEFERRRRVLLKIKIAVQIIVIAGLLYLTFGG